FRAYRAGPLVVRISRAAKLAISAVDELLMRGSPRSGFARFISVALGLLSLVPILGCGPKGDRLAIDGKVTLNGAPLDDGSIRFPTAGSGKLSTAAAMIKDGKYHVPQAKGLPPGTYRVEINSPDTKAPLVSVRPAPGEPAPPPTAPDRIPA